VNACPADGIDQQAECLNRVVMNPAGCERLAKGNSLSGFFYVRNSIQLDKTRKEIASGKPSQ
jgi:hypothetical protein